MTASREADMLHKTLGIEAYAVRRSGQHQFIGADYYHGGAVRMDIGGLHRAKFHAEMLRLAVAAGAKVHGETAIIASAPTAKAMRSRPLVVMCRLAASLFGTNGYTDAADRWLRQRLVPLRSRIIATVPLSANLMGELMPARVMYGETRKLHYYYRPSPDGTRILFGGRDGTIAGDADWPTRNLKTALVDIFPVLAHVEFDHSWFGYVEMNRDMVPRIFSRRGLC
jgi:glycine/D-amino acid oxidase-like deaminating enzyme